MEELIKAATMARIASRKLAIMQTDKKNAVLYAVADALEANIEKILAANGIDIENAKKNGLKSSFIDRLTLSEKSIKAIAEAIRDVAKLPDPVGEVIGGETRPNGLNIVKKRVPLGVIGIIYESRPNVTADAIALAIKSGNAVMLRGGSDAIYSNSAICDLIEDSAYKAGLPEGSVYLLRDCSRDAVNYLMGMYGYIDVLIPRGGKKLIESVVKNAKVPTIHTGAGNCHVYIDESADMDMALDIIENAKMQKPSVCNAAETLLVHKNIADAFMPKMIERLKGVELRGCERSMKYGIAIPATEDDYFEEYNELILAVKIVDSTQEAVEHINKYGTQHSEAIVTKSYENAEYFQAMVDAACVYVNASTRFTDGGEFGMGAEIGISSQKLHARGPMGLKELTTGKYYINGNGQIR